MKILIVDPLSPTGHINLNKIIIEKFKKFADIDLIISENMSKITENINVKCIPHSQFVYTGRYDYINKQLKKILFIKNIIKNNNYEMILFLSYEFFYFLLIKNLGSNIFIMEHNNIERYRNNWLINAVYKKSTKNLIHIVFEEYIKKYLVEAYGFKVQLIPHPHYLKNKIEYKNKKKGVLVFAPSSGMDENIKNMLILHVSNNKNMYLFMKKNGNSIFKNIKFSNHFKYYYKIMKCSDFVFSGLNYDYRVSGVLYEALSYGKPVIMFLTEYSKHLKQEYPSLVYTVDKLEEINSVIKNHVLNTSIYEKYFHEHHQDVLEKYIKNILEEAKISNEKNCYRCRY